MGHDPARLIIGLEIATKQQLPHQDAVPPLISVVFVILDHTSMISFPAARMPKDHRTRYAPNNKSMELVTQAVLISVAAAPHRICQK